MEKIALADQYFDLINKGLKTSTIRFGERNYQIGDCVFYSENSDLKTHVTIIDVVYKTMGHLTELDAKHDGFNSLKELKSTLKTFYPQATDNDTITQVVFKIKNKGDMKMANIGEPVKFNPVEKTRTYYFPNDEKVVLTNVEELVVRDSGSHRLKTSDGNLHIIPTGWLHIEIDAKDWTV